MSDTTVGPQPSDTENTNLTNEHFGVTTAETIYIGSMKKSEISVDIGKVT